MLTAIVDSVGPAVSVVSVASVSSVPDDVAPLASGKSVDDVTSVPSWETVEIPVVSVASSPDTVDDSTSELV